MKQRARPDRATRIPVGTHWTAAVILVIVTGVLGAALPAAHPHQSQAVFWAMAVAAAILFALPIRSPDRVQAAMVAARAGWYLGLAIIVAGAAALLVWGSGEGLWLVIIGWFLASAATSEEAGIMARSALSGLQVADVMTRDPDIAAAWCTVEHFAVHIADHSGQLAFPVIGTDGKLVGVVVGRILARILPAARRVLFMDQIALVVAPAYLAAPGDPAGSLLARPFFGGEVAAVVLDEDRVVGIVTAADIVQAAGRGRVPDSAGNWPETWTDDRDFAGR